MLRRILPVFLILALVTLSLSMFPLATVSAATPSSIQGLHVSGNSILNAANQHIRLLGVDRAGGEYMCIQGRGIWDGPVDAASIQAITSWNTNAIRIPLNEDCWLNINGVNAAYGGANYQQAVINFVNLVNSNGLVAILDLHWTNAGSTQATGQQPMPDADHAPAFWQSVATTFKNNSSVIFDLFNEPYPDSNSDTTAGWVCWRDGGTCPGMSYPAAGMQLLVTTVRNTGSTNIIMLGGLEYSNALSHWLTYKPTDPTGNLAASWHSYNFNTCSNTSCWNSQLLPVIQQVPLIAGEIGENDCAHGYIDSVMNWLDSNNSNYLGWTWNDWAGSCGTGPTLITDYSGTPTAFGVGLKNHLTALKQHGSPTPTSTPTPNSSMATSTPTKIINTATPTNLPTTTTVATFQPPTRTVVGPTNTPSRTPIVTGGALKVQVQNGGSDNTQQSQFHVNIVNTGNTAQSNLSVRIYIKLDGSQPISNYVIEKYWDQSGVVTVSAPVLASSNIYYYTLSYGSTALAVGSAWQFQGALHLASWSNNFDGSNDWWHTGYALGALPSAYTDTTDIPAYVGSSLVWGVTP